LITEPCTWCCNTKCTPSRCTFTAAGIICYITRWWDSQFSKWVGECFSWYLSVELADWSVGRCGSVGHSFKV